MATYPQESSPGRSGSRATTTSAGEWPSLRWAAPAAATASSSFGRRRRCDWSTLPAAVFSRSPMTSTSSPAGTTLPASPMASACRPLAARQSWRWRCLQVRTSFRGDKINKTDGIVFVPVLPQTILDNFRVRLRLCQEPKSDPAPMRFGQKVAM